MANEVLIFVKAVTQQAQSAITSLNKSWVGINSALEVGKKAAQALGEAYNFLVGDTQKYNQSVLQMMRITGQNAEMTSRMIQLTDDFGVSQEALTMAMRGAATKGIAFTTENLAKLSDEYLKLAPGVERTTFLVDQFGTRGAEMAKVLDKGSKAIREQSAAIDENLIATDANIKASEEWRIAQDNLNDSVAGLKNTIANHLIPILNDAYKTAELLVTWNERLNEAVKDQRQVILETSTSWEEYIDRMIYFAFVSGRIGEAQRDQLEHWRQYPERLAQATHWLGLLDERSWSLQESAAASDRSLQGMSQNLEGLAQTAPPAADSIAGLNDKMNGLRGAADGIAQAYNDMNTAQANLEAATQSFGEKVGGDLQSALEGAGVKGDKLHQALSIIDEVMGTSLDPAQKLQDITSQLANDYATGKITADEFRQKLVDQKTAMEGLYQPIVNARVALQDMKAELEILTSRVWKIAIEMGAPIPLPTPGGGGGGGGGGGRSAGAGGGGSIPSGLPGGPGANSIAGDFIADLTGASNGGGINPTNQTAGNVGGITITNLILPNVTNAGQFVAELGRLANNARNSGRGTQGA